MDLNNLRKKFEADEAPVPSDAWQRLEASLDKQTPRSPLMWWLGAILLFIGTGLGVSLLGNRTDSSIAQATHTTQANSTTSSIPTDQSGLELGVPAQSVKLNQINTQPKNKPKQDVGQKKDVTQSPANFPKTNSSASNGSNTSSGNSTTNTNDVPDYVRNNPNPQQGNSNTGRNRGTITTIVGGHRNRILNTNTEESTATGNDRLPTNQVASRVSERNNRTQTRITNPVISSVAEVIADNITNNNGGNNNNRRIGNNGNTTLPTANNLASVIGRNSIASTTNNGGTTSETQANNGSVPNSGVENGSSSNEPSTTSSATTSDLKTDSLTAVKTSLKTDSLPAAVNKPTESPAQTIARFSLWGEINIGNSPQTRINPNVTDGVLMQSAQLNNQWKPSIMQGAISVKYLLRPSVQLIGGVVWQYEQLSYSSSTTSSNQFYSRSLAADGSMVSNYTPIYQSNNININRHFVGLQTGAAIQILPRLQVSGLVQLPLSSMGTEGNSAAIKNWQLGMHYGLTPKIQLGAFWQQSLGTTHKIADGTTINRSYAGISLRYKLK